MLVAAIGDPSVTATAILPRFNRLWYLSGNDPAAFQREVKYGDDHDLLEVIRFIDTANRHSDRETNPREVACGLKMFFSRREAMLELRRREEKRQQRRWYWEKVVMPMVHLSGIVSAILAAAAFLH